MEQVGRITQLTDNLTTDQRLSLRRASQIAGTSVADAYRNHVRKAAADERERCALLCEALAKSYRQVDVTRDRDPRQSGYDFELGACAFDRAAAAIRKGD